MSYDVLALAQRKNVDERTLGDLFFDYDRCLPDITIVKVLSWLMKTLSGLDEQLGMTNNTLNTIFNEFLKVLPSTVVCFRAFNP